MTTKGPVDVFVSDKPPGHRLPRHAGKRAPAEIGTVGTRLERLEGANIGQSSAAARMRQVAPDRTLDHNKTASAAFQIAEAAKSRDCDRWAVAR